MKMYVITMGLALKRSLRILDIWGLFFSGNLRSNLGGGVLFPQKSD